MWSSFHSLRGVRAHGWMRLAAVLACVTGAPSVRAQQYYFVPSLEASGQYSSNYELESDSTLRDPSMQYIGTLSATMGRRTPRSQTEFRPLMRLQEFPDRSGVDPLEFDLPLTASFRTLRTGYMLNARWRRDDTINSERGQASFDESTSPGTPTDPDLRDTGVVLVGTTRTWYNIGPSVERDLTERIGLGVSATHESMSYESASTGIDYKNDGGSVYLRREMGPRSDLNVGPYYERFKAADDFNITDTYGVNFLWKYSWSETALLRLAGQVERNQEDLSSGPTTSATVWGLTASGTQRLQAGRWTYSVGRFLTPSGLGSRTQRDEVRVQYDRAFRQRFAVTGAVRWGHESQIGNDNILTRDRKLVRSEFSARWAAARTWIISAGVRYAWQDDILNATGSADNYTAFLSFGFRGLDPRRESWSIL